MNALIESCVAQTYANWELVIADGSEKNAVRYLVSQYQYARIRYVRLEGNNGIAENTNQAI
ncbi:glycosyltransferase, partial [Enterococcus lactis]|uniref:glycosyltransferase n=1 Tax=Enterococcus lactis TaxID=357441 RepID=UPI0039083090